MCCINAIILSLLKLFQIGKSKLFFHDADLRKLDQISNKVKEQVIICQSGNVGRAKVRGSRSFRAISFRVFYMYQNVVFKSNNLLLFP